MNTVTRFAAATLMVTAGLGMAGMATATSAYADDPPWPFVGYHWCPGLPFDPAWGPQWDPTTCHDAHHRDADGLVRVNDYWGPGPFQDSPVITNSRP